LVGQMVVYWKNSDGSVGKGDDVQLGERTYRKTA
jgi:hypothetical protein